MAARLDRHLALVGFMGAGKTALGQDAAARLGRPFVDLDEEIEQRAGASVAQLFERRGEPEFRALEERVAEEVLERPQPSVVALGGGAPTSAGVRTSLARRAIAVLVDVDPGEAWARVRGTDRPLARDEASFRALYDERRPLYADVAETVARDVDDAVLAAGEIAVRVGALETLGVPAGEGVALVMDETVAGIYGPVVQTALAGELSSTHELPPGEAAKTFAALERLLAELRLSRRGRLVACGGGCTTDAAGFAAAVYLRGIDWVAVPTTLVGQVDAAIGGKTAINLADGKNLAGAFHWPERTVVDPAALSTLPEAERQSGMAEVVKTGLLAGERFWELPDAELVRRCAAYKTAVCLRDPREQGERAILNLGHTFAHGLEAASGYSLPHGRAVALGLLAALRLSGLEDERAAIERVLTPKPVRVDGEAAWEAMARDKKAQDGRLRFVLLDRPGAPRVTSEVDPRDARRALAELIRD